MQWMMSQLHGMRAQVLNMKPQEVLGMLEEAAGTRMYETKKDAALRTLDKKQVKVDEIDKVSLSCPGGSSMQHKSLRSGAILTSCTAGYVARLTSASPLPQVLNEDILPALEKLRREKDQYYRWQTVTANWMSSGASASPTSMWRPKSKSLSQIPANA